MFVIEQHNGVGLSADNSPDCSSPRWCKLKGRLKTSLGEKRKLTEDQPAQSKQRRTDTVNIALACAMVAQTAWLCSLLLSQPHNEGQQFFVFFCNTTVRQFGLTHFYCRLPPYSCESLLSLGCLSLAHFTFHALRFCAQALMDEILMLQDEIGELQTCFSEELAESDSDGEAGDQLALQSTLTVLGERMATIRMKASGKRQLLEVGAEK